MARTNSTGHLKLSWFFDFHSHENVHIGRDSRPHEVADILAEAGVEEVTTHAKGHCGFTYYPTTLSGCRAHPRMVGDPFGDMITACADRGLHSVAYISFGIDGDGARRNPHWLKHFADGPFVTDDWFAYVCPYTPYLEESVIPQVEEILARYPVNGFFFDTMSALASCYCENCEHAFKAAFGRAQPRSCDEAGAGEHGAWRRERASALLARVGSVIQAQRPAATVGFNQVGCLPFPEALPEGCNRLTLDFRIQGPQSRQAARCAAYGASAPYDCEVMPTIFNGGWGDWTAAPPMRHEQIAAAIWARNGIAIFGDRLHPENRLAQPSFAAIQTVMSIRREMAQFAPPPSAVHRPDVLILQPRSGQYGEDCRYFAHDTHQRMLPFSGLSSLLLDAGQNVGISAEYCLADNLEQPGLVVLAEAPSIDEESEQTLRTFTEAGGQLLIIGNLPRVDGMPLNWAGVTQAKEPWQDHMYLPAPDDDEAPPVLVRGDHFALEAVTATVEQVAIAPLDMAHGIRFGWGIAPPGSQSGTTPALTRQAVGDRGGAVWCLPSPLCSDYQNMGNWQQVGYMRNLIKHILPRPFAAVDSLYGQVEIVPYSASDRCWIWLVHHGGESLHGEKGWPRTWGPLPPCPVTVRLQSARPSRVSINGEDVPFSWDNGRMTVDLTLSEPWRIVEVDFSIA